MNRIYLKLHLQRYPQFCTHQYECVDTEVPPYSSFTEEQVSRNLRVINHLFSLVRRVRYIAHLWSCKIMQCNLASAQEIYFLMQKTTTTWSVYLNYHICTVPYMLNWKHWQQNAIAFFHILDNHPTRDQCLWCMTYRFVIRQKGSSNTAMKHLPKISE